MKIIGEKVFAKGADGKIISRIGTIFLKTPGLVTKRGVHALQRIMWIEDINAERAAAGKPHLSPLEEEAELAESVDLIFTEEYVLIRPDPDRMDLAFRADEELQRMFSKRIIRYLNTNALKVRKALRERGENWRMSRQPISQEDMADLIAASKVAIGEQPLYYYNRTSGTRYLTASGYFDVENLDPASFRRQIAEIVEGLNKRNRLGQPEVDLFPTVTPPEIKRAFKALKVGELDDTALKTACAKLDYEWRTALPAELRDETVENFDWRNEMCQTLTRGPNDTNVGESELIAGIAPEFYRQIEWLPGARIDRGEVIFDAVYDEAARTQDPELLALCDNRVKSFLFNTTRLFGKVEFINIGRISRSLARKPVEGNRRGNVYLMQYKEEGVDDIRVQMIRLQKWGVAERLDEGKDLLQSIVETDEYSDYILDRRLMCRQLGMNLPRRLGFGHFTEKYRGNNEYNGVAVRTAYFVRSYITGIASDKIPRSKYRNPAFAVRFAELMGEAAAIDMVVGRRSSVTGELMFDHDYEVAKIGPDGLPHEIRITDHAGSFVEYERPYVEYVADYAAFALSRKEWVAEFAAFAAAYVNGFQRRLTEAQSAYLSRKKAFDELFSDRPYDTNGSGAYRWAMALKRLAACDPKTVSAILAKNLGC